MRTSQIVLLSVAAVVFTIVLPALYAWLQPQYNVYRQRLEGEALLAHSVAAKEVAVAEAKAKMESAQYLADAEVLRAEGVAKANKIIGDSLRGNENYLKYLYISNLELSKTAVIYIPTEAGIPILEATRLNTVPVPEAKPK